MHAKDETDPARERWAGAGHSTQSDSAQAGREAVVEAVRGKDPRLVVVFAAPRHDLDSLAAAAAEAAGPAQLIGCSSAGELSRHGHSSSSVVALALGGRGISAASAAGSADEDGPRHGGRAGGRLPRGGGGPRPARADPAGRRGRRGSAGRGARRLLGGRRGRAARRRLRGLRPSRRRGAPVPRRAGAEPLGGGRGALLERPAGRGRAPRLAADEASRCS